MAKRARCRCQDPAAVAVLARISQKDKQTQASIEAQLRETREVLVEPNGWRVVAEYQIRHRGSDLSGDVRYMEMIRDARAGKFSRLCLHKFDRLARRAYDRETYWHILTRECGVEVQAALEPYDLSTRAGKLTKKTSEFIADIYLDNLAEETMKGMKQKLLSGVWVGRAPFGYANRREEIGHNRFRRWVEPDPAQVETVKLAFGLFAGGEHTLSSLVSWLNDHGYLWEKGLPWRVNRLHRMLTNVFYIGILRWNGLEAQGSHERLIDGATFDRCHTILRDHDEYRERRVQHVYPLGRLLWFAELGCRAYADTQAHAGLSYYRSKADGPGGAQVYVRADQVEDQVAGVLEGLKIPPELHGPIRRQYRREIGEMVAPERAERERLTRKLAELEEESRGYVRLRAQGKITETEFDAERSRVSTAIGATRSDLSALEQGAQGAISQLDGALAFSGRMAGLWLCGTPSERRVIATIVFRRISIDNAGEITGYRLSTPWEYLLRLRNRGDPDPPGPNGGGGKKFEFVPVGGTERNHLLQPPVTQKRTGSPLSRSSSV